MNKWEVNVILIQKLDQDIAKQQLKTTTKWIQEVRRLSINANKNEYPSKMDKGLEYIDQKLGYDSYSILLDIKYSN